MVMFRVIAFMMISAATAAQAQQTAPAAPQPAAPSVAKVDNSQKVSCRVHMEGTMPRRVCMKNSDWAKLDSADTSKLPDATYQDRLRCTSTGAC
jgi:hypothetical protein